MKISVLTTSDPQVEELLRSCGAQVILAGLDALTELANPMARQPEAIVIDMRERGAIPPIVAGIKRQHPSTGILMILPALDASLMLEAMRAGVNECVADPLRLEDLEAALQRIKSQRPSARGGDVFAVVGAKGGVGATTVAVNVATMLDKLRPSSTLLIDLHLTYGDAGIYLGAEPRFSIVDALENMHRMDATFLRSLAARTKSGVHLLASSDRSVSTPLDVTQVRQLLELAATEFPYVVLDVPRLDAAMLDALDAAKAIVVVANQELATVRSAGRIASSLEQRYGKERVNVVMTRYNDDADIRQQDVERIVGRPVSHVFPNNYPVALASQSKGHPLVLDNHTKLASAITGFTRSLANIPVERPAQQKSSGLLSLISGRRR
jgi:pilus assembly protein CpaE